MRRIFTVGSFLLLAGICIPALALDYKTSWIGNTYGARDRVFVQMDSHCLFTSPDGKCFLNVPWEEGGEQAGIYKDGQVLSNPERTHGWGNEGGYAVAANSQYIFIAQGMNNEGGGLQDPNTWPPAGSRWDGLTRRTAASLGKQGAPFPGGKGGSGDSLAGSFLVINESPDGQPAPIRGLALDKFNRLYVSNPSKSQILVYDAAAMTRTATWSIADARHIAVAPDGTLWIIKGRITTDGTVEPGAPTPEIVHYTSAGTQLPAKITTVAVPTGLAFNPQGRLLVSDNGPDQQVKIFDISGNQPQLVGTFGEKGGIFSGVPGKVQPLKFNGLQGVGCDLYGNTYVCCNGWGGNGTGLSLESYKPDGTQNWVLYGLEFVDQGDFDRSTDAEHIYTNYEHFTMDYSKPTGQEWSYVGYTMDRFRFPDDPRLHFALDTSFIRNVNGHRLMYMTNMYSTFFAVYRFEPGTEIAIPCGFFAKGDIHSDTFPPNRPDLASSRFVWIDRDGDGQMDADEYESDGQKEPALWAWWVDSNGDIWQGYQYSQDIVRFPLQNFTTAGVPVYSRSSVEIEHAPAPFDATGGGASLERTLYVPEEDAMYLSGYTQQNPNPAGWWKIIGRVLVRYENWSGKNGPRKKAWEIHPANVADNKQPACFDEAGDLVFVVEVKSAVVTVYDKHTGAEIATMPPGPEVGSTSGWVDIPYGISAYQRDDGEYLVLVEEDAYAKNTLYRFRLPSTATPDAPTGLQAEQTGAAVTLTWQAVSNATRYSVERSVSGGDYQFTGYAESATFTDTDVKTGTAYSYRVIAMNWGGSSQPSSPVAITMRTLPLPQGYWTDLLHLGSTMTARINGGEIGTDYLGGEATIQPYPGLQMAGIPGATEEPLVWTALHDDDGVWSANLDTYVKYWHIYVISPSERQVRFHFKHDDDLYAWNNGIQIIKHDGYHNGAEEVVNSTLAIGMNSITIKLREVYGEDYAAIRVTDLSDQPFTDLTYRLRPGATITGFAVADRTTASSLYTNESILDTNITITGAEATSCRYMITENATTPSANDPQWLNVAPTTYTIASLPENQLITLYAWVKDDQGLITGAQAVILYNTTAPVVTPLSFTAESATQATVRWQTDVLAYGKIRYRRTDESTWHESALSASPTCDHIAGMTGLQPNIAYTVVLVNNEASSQPIAYVHEYEQPSGHIIEGPNVSLTYTKATITWTTDQPVASGVEWGETDRCEWSIPSETGPAQEHAVTFSIPFKPNITYHYRLINGGDASGTYTFTSLPWGGSVTRTLYVDANTTVDYGIQNGTKAAPFARILDAIASIGDVSAAPGNEVRVLVASGHYAENVIVGDNDALGLSLGDKWLKVIAEEGPDNTIIDCDGSRQTYALTTHMVLDGFTLNLNGTVHGDICTGNIYSESAVLNCRFQNSGSSCGAWLWGTHGALVSNCSFEVRDVDPVLRLNDRPSDITVEDCIFLNPGVAVNYHAHWDTVDDVWFRRNIVYDADGIALRDRVVTGMQVYNNIFVNGKAIYEVQTSDLQFYNNTLINANIENASASAAIFNNLVITTGINSWKSGAASYQLAEGDPPFLTADSDGRNLIAPTLAAVQGMFVSTDFNQNSQLNPSFAKLDPSYSGVIKAAGNGLQIFAGIKPPAEDAYGSDRHNVASIGAVAGERTWPIPGDANLDCKVNIIDLIFVRNRLSKDPATGDNWQADVNGDGKINIIDLIYTRNRLNSTCP